MRWPTCIAVGVPLRAYGTSCVPCRNRVCRPPSADPFFMCAVFCSDGVRRCRGVVVTAGLFVKGVVVTAGLFVEAMPPRCPPPGARDGTVQSHRGQKKPLSQPPPSPHATPLIKVGALTPELRSPDRLSHRPTTRGTPSSPQLTHASSHRRQQSGHKATHPSDLPSSSRHGSTPADLALPLRWPRAIPPRAIDP